MPPPVPPPVTVRVRLTSGPRQLGAGGVLAGLAGDEHQGQQGDGPQAGCAGTEREGRAGGHGDLEGGTEIGLT